MRINVLDTNVWMLDSKCYQSLDGVIGISLTVIQELDKHKNGFGTIAVNSRRASKLIGKVADKVTKLYEIVEHEEYKFMIVDAITDFEKTYKVLSEATNDDKIIASAISATAFCDEVILYSNDNNVRSKANVLGLSCLRAIMYDDRNVDTSDFYEQIWIDIEDSHLAKAFEGTLKVSDLIDENLPLHTNLYLCHADKQYGATVAGKDAVKIIDTNKSKKVNKLRAITPASTEQWHLVNAIRNPNVKIVTCMGRTGSGKTLVTLATAITDLDNGMYIQLKMLKPYCPAGNTVGMLKGTYEDKVAPIKASFEGALDFLGVNLDMKEKCGQIQFDVPEFERGKTYHNTLVIVDEVQNMTPLEVKMLITRVGKGSKIILLGDLRQVDNQFMTESFNGLAHTIDRLTGREYFANVYLRNSERASFLNEVDDLL